jgi:UPF0716 family protein affecting phage T7 exclusion
MRFSFRWLFVAFIAELFSLFLLADALGAWWTLAWVLAAMMLGVWIIYDAGDTLSTLGGIFMTPAERVAAIRETPWLLLVGILFFLPGVVSDVFAIIIWLPSVRRALLRKPLRTPSSSDTPTPDTTKSAQDHVVLEGEFIDKTHPDTHTIRQIPK